MKYTKTAKIKIADIASKSGFSLTTVSSVLGGNKKYRVATETRKKIEMVAKELHYRSNILGKGLCKQRFYKIGILFHDVRDRCYSDIMASIQMALYSRSYTALFDFWRNYGLEKAFNHLCDHGVDGIITNAQPSAIAKLNPDIPICYYTPWHNRENDCVVIERAVAFRRLLEKCYENGIRKYSTLINEDDPRLLEQLDFLQTYDLEQNPAWLQSLNIDSRQIEMAIKSVLKEPRPEMIACQSDFLAIRLCRELHDRGIEIGSGIRILGFDNIQESQYCYPPLTTMDIHKDQIAEHLVEIILSRIEKPDLPQQTITVQPDMVWRESLKL